MVIAKQKGSTRRRLEGVRPQSEKLAMYLRAKVSAQDRVQTEHLSLRTRGRSMSRENPGCRNEREDNDTDVETREPPFIQNVGTLPLADEVEANRRPRTIPCAQDYYPTSFDPSARDFSPVRLRKKHFMKTFGTTNRARSPGIEQRILRNTCHDEGMTTRGLLSRGSINRSMRWNETAPCGLASPTKGRLQHSSVGGLSPVRGLVRSESTIERSQSRQGLNTYMKKLDERAAYARLSRRKLSPDRMNSKSMREIMKKIDKQHRLSIQREMTKEPATAMEIQGMRKKRDSKTPASRAGHYFQRQLNFPRSLSSSTSVSSKLQERKTKMIAMKVQSMAARPHLSKTLSTRFNSVPNIYRPSRGTSRPNTGRDTSTLDLSRQQPTQRPLSPQNEPPFIPPISQFLPMTLSSRSGNGEAAADGENANLDTMNSGEFSETSSCHEEDETNEVVNPMEPAPCLFTSAKNNSAASTTTPNESTEDSQRQSDSAEAMTATSVASKDISNRKVEETITYSVDEPKNESLEQGGRDEAIVAVQSWSQQSSISSKDSNPSSGDASIEAEGMVASIDIPESENHFVLDSMRHKFTELLEISNKAFKGNYTMPSQNEVSSHDSEPSMHVNEAEVASNEEDGSIKTDINTESKIEEPQPPDAPVPFDENEVYTAFDVSTHNSSDSSTVTPDNTESVTSEKDELLDPGVASAILDIVQQRSTHTMEVDNTLRGSKQREELHRILKEGEDSSNSHDTNVISYDETDAGFSRNSIEEGSVEGASTDDAVSSGSQENRDEIEDVSIRSSKSDSCSGGSFEESHQSSTGGSNAGISYVSGSNEEQ